jgi:hypothetical protein
MRTRVSLLLLLIALALPAAAKQASQVTVTLVRWPFT